MLAHLTVNGHQLFIMFLDNYEQSLDQFTDGRFATDNQSTNVGLHLQCILDPLTAALVIGSL